MMISFIFIIQIIIAQQFDQSGKSKTIHEEIKNWGHNKSI